MFISATLFLVDFHENMDSCNRRAAKALRGGQPPTAVVALINFNICLQKLEYGPIKKLDDYICLVM